MLKQSFRASSLLLCGALSSTACEENHWSANRGEHRVAERIPHLESHLIAIHKGHTCKTVSKGDIADIEYDIRTYQSLELQRLLNTYRLDYPPIDSRDGMIALQAEQAEIIQKVTSQLSLDTPLEGALSITPTSLFVEIDQTKERLLKCNPDLELETESPRAELWSRFTALDSNNDGTIQIHEHAKARTGEKVKGIAQRFTLESGASTLIVDTSFDDFPLDRDHTISLMSEHGLSPNDTSWVTQDLSSLDTNNDMTLNANDDLDFNGIIDKVDFKLIRILMDYFKDKYGDNFDKSKITRNDLIFAYFDLAGPLAMSELGIGAHQIAEASSSEFGFTPQTKRILLDRDVQSKIIQEEKTVYTRKPGGSKTAVKISGTGGVFGYALSRLFGMTPAGRILMTASGLVNGVETTKEPDQIIPIKKMEVTGKVVKTVEHILVRTESDRPVRVMIIQMEQGKTIFVFDTSIAIEHKEMMRIVKKYKYGSLEHSTETIELTSKPEETLLQTSSGRLAVYDELSERVALYQEDEMGVYQLVSFYHKLDQDSATENVKGTDIGVLAKAHSQSINLLFGQDELKRLFQIQKGLKVFDSNAGLEKEASLVIKLDRSFE